MENKGFISEMQAKSIIEEQAIGTLAMRSSDLSDLMPGK
jgi:hypothetical protein